MFLNLKMSYRASQSCFIMKTIDKEMKKITYKLPLK